jgi:hypothetical protein
VFESERIDIIAYAVILAIILGILVSVFFIFVNKESYSALYIIPNSTIYDSNENSIVFSYGVTSYETGKTNYEMNIFSSDKLVEKKEFSLNNGEIFEERIKIFLPPETQFPDKISLKLNNGKNVEEVNFWIKSK